MAGSVDISFLKDVSEIYSHHYIAEVLGISRADISKWLKSNFKVNKLSCDERDVLKSLIPEPPKGTRTFRFIDLFAGIGGLRIGFEDIGGECVFTSEWNRYAVQTYRANHYTPHRVHGDIREITQASILKSTTIYEHIDRCIPDHDVLLAGFPCQPFSIAGVSKKNALGRAHGFEDATQGTLFFDLARIIAAKKPAAFVLENVKNLKSHDKGKTFSIILQTMNDLGYEIADCDAGGKSHDPKVIDGQHFVPQHRERIVLVGFRRDLGLIDGFTLKDISRFYLPKKPLIGDILEAEDTIDPKYVLSESLWTYLQNYAKKHKSAGNGFGFGLVDKTSVARTLSARYYKDGSEILVSRGKGCTPRKLTITECARLMGFESPGRNKFILPVSDTQAYKQFGNSVVVPVFSAIARLMKSRIEYSVRLTDIKGNR